MFYLYVVIFFLWTAIGLYILLGGADFGAGIVEFFTGPKNKKRVRRIMYNGMGPVWETNHMWLIIVIVILFVGFPKIYSTLSTNLHIPLLLMLVGIIARGTAFAFRNYDAVKDDWQNVYDAIFTISSLFTPFFLGIIAGATVAGSIDLEATGFLQAYIFSWLTPFGCAIGFFTIAICGYLSSCYALAQVKDKEDQDFLSRKVKVFTFVVVLFGGMVFLSAHYSGIPLIQWIFGETIGQIAVLLATLSLGGVFYGLKNKWFKTLRIFAGFQVVMILLAVTYQHYPNLVVFKNGYLSLLESGSDSKSIASLAWALMLGSIFILPGAFHLIYSFQSKKK